MQTTMSQKTRFFTNRADSLRRERTRVETQLQIERNRLAANPGSPEAIKRVADLDRQIKKLNREIGNALSNIRI